MRPQDECEAAIRVLCHVWRESRGLLTTPPEQLSFPVFFAWLQAAYPQYLRFRTSATCENDVEIWFNQELKTAWRR